MAHSIDTALDWTTDPTTRRLNSSPAFRRAAANAAEYLEQMAEDIPDRLSALEAGADIVGHLVFTDHLAPPATVNIMAKVWVQLTPFGLDRLLNVFPPTSESPHEYTFSEETGWACFPVHEFMYVFGPIMYFGFDLGGSVFINNQFQFFPPAD